MQVRPLPFREYFLKVGEKVPLAIDWEAWLENRWVGGRAYGSNVVVRPTLATGFEYKCTVPGYTASSEPSWPTTVGGTVIDGQVTWTAQAVTAASLTATVSSAPWSAPSGIAISSQSVTRYVAKVLVDTTTSSAGQNYDVLNTLNLSDGTQKIGTWRIRVS